MGRGKGELKNFDYDIDEYVREQDCGWEQESRQVYDPHDEWVEDRWRIQIDGCATYEHDGEQRQHCDTRWLNVTEQEYGHFRVGMHYPNPA